MKNRRRTKENTQSQYKREKESEAEMEKDLIKRFLRHKERSELVKYTEKGHKVRIIRDSKRPKKSRCL